MLANRTARALNPGEELVFFTVAWDLVDPAGFQRLAADDSSRRAFSVIRVSGVTTGGESVVADIQDPHIRVYIRDRDGAAFDTLRNAFIEQKIAQFAERGGAEHRGGGDQYAERARARAAADFDGQIVSHKTISRRYLQGMRKAHDFVEILVTDGWARRALYTLATATGLHTANERLEPCLEYRIHADVSASCWVRARAPCNGMRPATMYAQIYATTSGLERLQGPPPMDVPPLLVASIDIECFSESGEFPRAKNPSDFISIIGVHLSRANDADPAHARTIMFVAKACAPVDGCEVRAHATEKAMLYDFIAFMGTSVHPEVYVTYNGLNFDWGYMYERVVTVHHLDLKPLGVYRTSRKLELINKDKKDGRKLSFFNITGTLNLDVMIPIADDYKLPSYKLDNVAEHFLGIRKIDLPPSEIFRLTSPTATAADAAVVVTYCVRDVELPHKLMHALSLLLNKLSESETVNTTLNDLVTRGQGIKIFSYIAGLCAQHDDGLLIDDKPMAYNFLGGDKYEGAFVKTPLLADDKSCFHCDWPVVALDVGSLYPTIMRTFNLCFSTYQQDDSQVCASPRTFEWVEHDRQERHTFDQRADGVLPGAMRALREERQAVRARQKVVAKDSLAWKVLEARQLSIKVVMNSAYGSLGAGEKSMLAHVPVAKTITYLGRQIICECARHVEDAYGFRVVYIDTDSCYVEVRKLELAANHEALLAFAFDMGATLEKAVSAHIRTHFQMVDAEAFVLECEDVMRGLLIPTKKRYCCRLYKSPTEKSKLLIKGLSVKRRDSCKLFQETLSRILERAIDVRARKDARPIIIEELDDAFGRLLRNEIPIEQLATSKALRAKYEGTPPVHFVVAEKRRARGETVRPGERVPFVFIQVANERAVRTQGDRAEDPAYVTAHNLKIDYGFYLESQMRGPCEQLLVPFWPGVSNYLKEWMARLRGQKSIRSFFAPVPTPAVALDDDATFSQSPAKRARVYDGIPCEVMDDSD
jgi:DNA polymerase delta subunit 1